MAWRCVALEPVGWLEGSAVVVAVAEVVHLWRGSSHLAVVRRGGSGRAVVAAVVLSPQDVVAQCQTAAAAAAAVLVVITLQT